MEISERLSYSWKAIKDGRISKGELQVLVEWQAHEDAPPRAYSWEAMRTAMDDVDKEIVLDAPPMTKLERREARSKWEKHGARFVQEQNGEERLRDEDADSEDRPGLILWRRLVNMMEKDSEFCLFQQKYTCNDTEYNGNDKASS